MVKMCIEWLNLILLGRGVSFIMQITRVIRILKIQNGGGKIHGQDEGKE